MKITRHKAELMYRAWLDMQERSRYAEYQNLNEFIESLTESGYEVVE